MIPSIAFPISLQSGPANKAWQANEQIEFVTILAEIIQNPSPPAASDAVVIPQVEPFGTAEGSGALPSTPFPTPTPVSVATSGLGTVSRTPADPVSAAVNRQPEAGREDPTQPEDTQDGSVPERSCPATDSLREMVPSMAALAFSDQTALKIGAERSPSKSLSQTEHRPPPDPEGSLTEAGPKGPKDDSIRQRNGSNMAENNDFAATGGALTRVPPAPSGLLSNPPLDPTKDNLPADAKDSGSADAPSRSQNGPVVDRPRSIKTLIPVVPPPSDPPQRDQLVDLSGQPSNRDPAQTSRKQHDVSSRTPRALTTGPEPEPRAGEGNRPASGSPATGSVQPGSAAPLAHASAIPSDAPVKSVPNIAEKTSTALLQASGVTRPPKPQVAISPFAAERPDQTLAFSTSDLPLGSEPVATAGPLKGSVPIAREFGRTTLPKMTDEPQQPHPKPTHLPPASMASVETPVPSHFAPPCHDDPAAPAGNPAEYVTNTRKIVPVLPQQPAGPSDHPLAGETRLRTATPGPDEMPAHFPSELDLGKPFANPAERLITKPTESADVRPIALLPAIEAALPLQIEAAAPRPSSPGVENMVARPVTPAAVPGEILQLVKAAPDGPVTLILSPEDLGKLRFQVIQTDQGMHIHLSVENPEMLDLLRRQGDQLLVDLRQGGFVDASLSFSGDGANGTAGQRNPQSAPADRPDAQQPQDTAPPPHRPTVPSGALDLRL